MKNASRDLLKKISIIGEGTTEKHYFTHLKSMFGVYLKVNCDIRPKYSKQNSLESIEKAIKEVLSDDNIAICVFDADKNKRGPKEQIKFNELKKNI